MLYLRIHMYTYMREVTINERRGDEFEGEEKGYMGEFGGRKNRGEMF